MHIRHSTAEVERLARAGDQQAQEVLKLVKRCSGRGAYEIRVGWAPGPFAETRSSRSSHHGHGHSKFRRTDEAERERLRLRLALARRVQ